MSNIEAKNSYSGRGSELFLLLLSGFIGVSAFAIVGLTILEELPAHFFAIAAISLVVSISFHLVIRWKAPYADPLLIPLAGALNGIGLAMIYRLDLATINNAAPTHFADRQFMWTLLSIAVAVCIVIFLRDHRSLRRISYTSLIASFVLLALPLIPGLGTTIHGARIWIQIAGFSFQPAEIVKITLTIFFAGYLVDNRDTLALGGKKFLGLQLPRLRDLGPIVVAWVASILILVFQKDLGTSLLLFGLFVAMLYIATHRLSWIIIGLLMFAVGVSLVLTQFPHVQGRFNAWLHAMEPAVFERAYNGSGQLVRGLFGMADGGLFGTGWGNGHPDLVPFAYSDFIIPSLGEELGLTGLMAILIIYFLLTIRGIRISLGTRDGFGKLLAAGLSFVMAWQVFVVVGGVTRVIPLTGLAAPFLAQGGSALLSNWIIIALLIRISDNARRPSPLPLRNNTPKAATPIDGSETNGSKSSSDSSTEDTIDFEKVEEAMKSE